MAVLALVDKETRLLPLQPVYVELQPVLRSYVIGTSSLDKPVLPCQQIRLKRKGGLRLVVNVPDRISHHLGQGIGYLHAAYVHSSRMSLHHRRASIHVNNQSGQVISLAMHQTVGIGLRIAYQAQRHTQGTG